MHTENDFRLIYVFDNNWRKYFANQFRLDTFESCFDFKSGYYEYKYLRYSWVVSTALYFGRWIRHEPDRGVRLYEYCFVIESQNFNRLIKPSQWTRLTSVKQIDARVRHFAPSHRRYPHPPLVMNPCHNLEFWSWCWEE